MHLTCETNINLKCIRFHAGGLQQCRICWQIWENAHDVEMKDEREQAADCCNSQKEFHFNLNRFYLIANFHFLRLSVCHFLSHLFPSAIHKSFIMFIRNEKLTFNFSTKFFFFLLLHKSKFEKFVNSTTEHRRMTMMRFRIIICKVEICLFCKWFIGIFLKAFVPSEIKSKYLLYLRWINVCPVSLFFPFSFFFSFWWQNIKIILVNVCTTFISLFCSSFYHSVIFVGGWNISPIFHSTNISIRWRLLT